VVSGGEKTKPNKANFEVGSVPGLLLCGVFFDYLLLLVLLEGGQFFAEVCIGQGKDLHSENRGVFGAGFSDSHGRHRHAGRHLYGAQQRIHPAQARARVQRHAYDRQRCFGRHGTGQVGGHARGGDYDLNSVFGGVFCEIRGNLRRPMGRNDPHERLDAEIAELLDAAFHDLHVAVRAHYYCDEGCFFRYHIVFSY